MHQIDILNTDWPEVEAIAKHLNRSNELVKRNVFGYISAVCERKKVTDREYKIIKTSVGLLTVMDYDDLNYTPEPIVGRFYWCKLENAKIGPIDKTYLCQFNCITLDMYQVTCQMCNNNRQPEGHCYYFEWMKNQVRVVSFEPADVEMFFPI